MKISKSMIGIAAAAALAFGAACNEGTKEKPVSREAENAPTAAPAPAPASAEGTTPAPAPAVSASAPAAPSAPSAGGSPESTVSGKILETMDSGGYTYLRLASSGGEVWAAVNAAKVKKGQTVTVVDAMPMDGFESKTLHRKFDRILFGSLAQPGGKAGAIDAAAAPQGQMPPGHPDASDPRFREMMAAQHAAAGQGPANVGDVKVPRAEGGKTVAEIVAQRKTLADKDVAVRGKVVKFLPQIMGRNWLHIRDGSGSAENKDNDLTVTTDDTAAIGDVVVVRGTVRIDQDFGAGYAYPVMIEKAALSK